MFRINGENYYRKVLAHGGGKSPKLMIEGNFQCCNIFNVCILNHMLFNLQFINVIDVLEREISTDTLVGLKFFRFTRYTYDYITDSACNAIIQGYS